MGLELKYPRETLAELARILVADVNKDTEKARRIDAAERVKLYRDDYKRLLAWTLSRVFVERSVYQRIERLIPFCGGTSFLKRVADELGRPLYAVAPQRRVVLPNGGDATVAQEAWNGLCKEMETNAKMDTMARLLTVCNAVFGFVRYVPDIGMQLDVMTPDMLTVTPHPEVPTRALGITYTKSYHDGKPNEQVVWDDTRYFTMGPLGGVRGAPREHNFEMLPFLEVHQRGRTDCYWLDTVGDDLVSQTKQSMFFDIVVVKKIKTQSHIQLVYSGDMSQLVKDQIPDEESILMADQGTLAPLDLQSDPTKIIDTKLANEATVAANYGISRDRLNQKTAAPTDDDARNERTQELAGVMVPAEVRLFEIVKRVAREHPLYAGKIPDDAMLVVDLGQIHNRVDRTTQLAVRTEERRMGLRSGVDDVLEDNPEYGGDRKLAMKHIEEKMAEEAEIIKRRRALNIPEDASPEEPGQDPAVNGAMGPKVRDGEMSKDTAAAAARTGGPGPVYKEE